VSGVATGASERQRDRRLWLAIAAFALLCILINPAGYIGASGDDGRYRDAALCWVANGGMCLPHDHWSSRWPVIAPVAAGIALFGDSRAAIGLGPLLYWAAALALIAQLGRRWISEDSGKIAVAILAATPILTSQALQPTADVAEFAFQLAALLAATQAYRFESRRWAVAAGVFAGLAFEVRETSALFIAASALAWLFLERGRRNILLPAVAGLVATIGAEMLVYAAATGDPLGRYRLAFGHVAIATSELPAGFDTGQNPLFNPAYIASWKREAGIVWAWPLDPWLNLLASLRIGATLWAGILATLLFRRTLAPPRRRGLALVAGGALLVSGLLIYGLALDPKSRLFLLLAAAAAIIAGGYIGSALRRPGNLLATALLGLFFAVSLPVLYASPTILPLEPAARRWIDRHGEMIETDPTTRAYLAFVPGADRLAPVGSGRPLRLSITLSACAEQAAAITRVEKVRVGIVASAARGYPKIGQFELCLLKITPKAGG
jgi:4-amino-4-deoxy-L-arabinose transferase-like glycosyltransferase